MIFVRHLVMTVDDVQSNLDILEAILENDYDIVSATSGAEVLKYLDSHKTKPDIILLDVSMPGMDGFELLEALHANPSLTASSTGIPVIFVTSEDDVGAEERGLELGAVDYIKKPYNEKIIPIKIRNHIDLKIYRDKLEEMVYNRTRQLRQRTEELSATHSAIIMGMSLLSESRDKVTGSHLIRIQSLTRLLAEALYRQYPDMLTRDIVDSITIYSPLHDVGKVGVPDAVLKKQGRLTSEEFDQMKAHTTDGGDILRQIAEFLPPGTSQLDIAIEIAESHHERYDGTGYPNRLSGENIPLSARIVSVSDVYDALRSPRSYKLGFTHEEAMNIILKGDGRTEPHHFDPRVLEAFNSVHVYLRQAYDSNPDPHIGKE